MGTVLGEKRPQKPAVSGDVKKWQKAQNNVFFSLLYHNISGII